MVNLAVNFSGGGSWSVDLFLGFILCFPRLFHSLCMKETLIYDIGLVIESCILK